MPAFTVTLQDAIDENAVVELQLGDFVRGNDGPKGDKGDKGDTGDVTPAAEAARDAAIVAQGAAETAATNAAASAADANGVRADIANTADPLKGDALVGVKQPFTGAVARTQHAKNSENLVLTDWAVGNGIADDTTPVADALAASVSSGLIVNGLGKIYKVTVLPSDFSRFTRAAFKLDEIIYPTEDFLSAKTSKITNARAYTAWPQDKAYVLNNQIKVWCNFGDSHLDGDIRPGYVISEDGGVSYQEVTLLDPTIYGHTCWSAGVAGGFEYAIVRTTDAPPFAYKLYKRAVPSGAGGNYLSGWTVTNITFPIPVWSADVQPVMIHSFTVGTGGIIVVGGSLTEGAILYTSSDGGATWVHAQTLLQSSTAEEPSVKYEDGIYAGFMRHGGGGNPRFWISRDDLASIQFFSAPAGYFGPTPLDDATVSLQLVDGVVHAFTSYRSGTHAGDSDDQPTPLFYIRANLSSGDNIWSHAQTFRIGTAYHQELGGASGVGQGSVAHYNDKIILLYGSEERTGTVSPTNRINNLWQTVISLKKNAGQIDYRTLSPDDRSANNPFMGVSDGSWLMKEGRVVVRSDQVLSAAYPNVPSDAGNFVIDGKSSNAGITIATSAGFVAFYSVTNAGSFSGVRVDNTSGTVALMANGSEVVRLDGSTNSFRPSSNNTRDLGGGTRYWANGYINTVNTFGLRVAEGANAKQGTAVLVAGSVVVANTSVTANSRIFLTSNVPGGTPGFVRVSARTAGTSFTITSSSGTDTSTIAYQIFEPS